MNLATLKEEAKVGFIEKDYIDYLKNLYITDIFQKKNNVRAANALVAYASYLNKEGVNSDNYPMYLTLLSTNNGHAIDALLAGYIPEDYLDFVQPNRFIVRSFLDLLTENKRNEVYEVTLKVVFGFLRKVYNSSEEGWQLYQPTITDVNNIGKYLNEEKDQDDELNRDILDVLLYIAKLDKIHETDQAKLDVARQASRIRSDFFDATRTLLNSITEVILQKSDNPDFGTAPDHVYTD